MAASPVFSITGNNGVKNQPPLQPDAPGSGTLSQESFRTVKVVSKIAKWNRHRLLLAVYLFALGMAVVGITTQGDPKEHLTTLYISQIVTPVLMAVGMAAFYFRVKKSLVPVMIRIIDEYHQAVVPAGTIKGPFLGIQWPKWRFGVMIGTSWMLVVCSVIMIIVQSYYLAQVVERLGQPITNFHGQLIVTNEKTTHAMVGITAAIVAGAVACLVSALYGSYEVTLMCGYFRAERLGMRTFYPVALYQTPDDLKPVYLNQK